MILKVCPADQYRKEIEQEHLQCEGIKQSSFFLGIMAFNFKYKWISLVLGNNVPSIKGLAQEESKSINLNIVRLRFDAFVIKNGIRHPICPPIYSHGINNLKCALTGDLRIVRMDHCTSPAKGGQEIFLLVERVTKKGRTPLNLAIETRNLMAIKTFCLFGADVNKKHHKNGFTPLRHAIEMQYVEAIQLLLLHPMLDIGAQTDFQGLSPFQFAIMNSSSKEVMEIINKFAHSVDD
ncbi:hypothetical protein YQE_09529, partial [Dendroctonus ponderosae]